MAPFPPSLPPSSPPISPFKLSRIVLSLLYINCCFTHTHTKVYWSASPLNLSGSRGTPQKAKTG